MEFCYLFSNKGKLLNNASKQVDCMLNNKLNFAESTYPLIMATNKDDFLKLVKDHILAEKEHTQFIYNKILAPGAVQILIFKKGNKNKALKYNYIVNMSGKKTLAHGILRFILNGFTKASIKGYVFNGYIYGNHYSKQISKLIHNIPREDIETIYDTIHKAKKLREFEDFYKAQYAKALELNKTLFKTKEYKNYIKLTAIYPFIFNLNRLISEDIKYFTPKVKKEIEKFRNKELDR